MSSVTRSTVACASAGMSRRSSTAHAVRKAKVKRQKRKKACEEAESGYAREVRPRLLPFYFCLLPSQLYPRRRLFVMRERDRCSRLEESAALAQRRLGVELREVWIVCSLREVREDDVGGCAVEVFAKPRGYVLVREVAVAREYPLLQLPGVNVTRLEHVAAVVRLDDYRPAAAQTFRHERRDVPEVHQCCDAHALVCGDEAEIVGGVVRDCERVKVNLAYLKILARRNLDRAVAQGFGALARLVRVARLLAYVCVARRA